ncbi:S8 family serine peptidase [Streptomyces sp. NPDC006283]|uniref:S8 family serine peptidase n=1 Tax=Streptomyces sp. NPDC006283 TaxID=3156741 RepID=UPI0033BD2AE2
MKLITGDTVHVGIDADGKPVARDIQSAARPDGSAVVFHTITRKGNVYVVPNDALALLDNGLLDWGLFDLKELVTLVAADKSGEAGEVPVLVTYADKAAAHKAQKVAGATGGRALPSINGRSMDIADGGRWWQGVRGKRDSGSAARSAGSLAGVKKVWLDGLAKIDLETSVPQIGANTAWDRGYDGASVSVAVLDTGIDPNHPDVSGNLVEQVDFTGNASGARDGHGHGTHVAATILGTGDASKGLRKGVAPRAKLRVGKVLSDSGSGAMSSIIAGMEWAAHSGAKVVNMSLGGNPSDGTDPLSQSLNQLSRTTGTLFVVAAGNSGPTSGTVGAPGAADEALTVAAVDKTDKMANFSSRGPRVRDGAAKPDIAAPGVAIVAARAAGTTMGTAVDEHYTKASGTSMAAPHVAGAAAILAQQHPDMTGHEIKAMLMGTAADLGHDVDAQGVGRVDVAAALDPKIIASRIVNFGRLTYPHAPQTKKVTYTNHTDEAITLRLAASISSGDQPAPAGLVTPSTEEVVVPANGSAEVSVTVDGRVLGSNGVFGRYTGQLVARDSTGAVRATSRVSTFLEPQRHPLTVNVVRPAGATAVQYGNAAILPVDNEELLHDGPVAVPGGETITAPLFAGTYSVAVPVSWQDASGEWHNAAPLVAETTLAKATTVTLDLRRARPLKVQTPESTETYHAFSSSERVSATGAWGMTAEFRAAYGADEPNWWALPTGRVKTGTLAHRTSAVLTTPVVTMRAVGGGDTFSLSARYQFPDVSTPVGLYLWEDQANIGTREIMVRVPRLATDRKASVVHAGTGTAAELAKVDAQGKLVLVTPTDVCKSICNFPKLRDERVAAAAAAGAIGVLVAAPGLTALGSKPLPEALECKGGPRNCPAVKPYAALPVLSVGYAQAERLMKRIEADPSNVQISIGGRATPTVYSAAFSADGLIPDLPYRVRKKELNRVDHHFHADRPGEVTDLTWQQHSQSAPAVSLEMPRTDTQQTLTTYVTRQDDALNRFGTAWTDDTGWPGNETQDVVLATRNNVRWNTGPTVPGAVPQVRTKSGFTVQTGMLCSGCRQGDTFYPTFYLTSSAGARQAMIGIVNNNHIAETFFGAFGCEAPACDFRLLNQSGQEVERRTERLEYSIPLPFGNQR